MKTATRNKNAVFKYNNRDGDSEKRWVGMAGEATLLDWFNNSPWSGQATSHYQSAQSDKSDFTFGSLEIDVKIASKEGEPTDYDFMYIYETQYERIFEHGVINTLVFGYYILPRRTCVLIGCMTLRDFDDNRKFYEAGFGRYPTSKYPLSTNDYAVQVGDAERKGILHPLNFLDQLR